MAQSFTLYPSGDVSNDGWTLVGSGLTELWEILSAQDSDASYIRCPSYRGGAVVSFPFDPTGLPVGAIIDSVTIFVRMKTSAGSGPRTLTVNLMTSENMGRFTSRTITATSAFTTFEVGTYTRDPLGKAWDINRLNKLRLRCFSLSKVFDAINVSQLYVRINYHGRPTVKVTAPTGTIATPSPEVKWTYSHAEGTPQRKYNIKIFRQQQITSTHRFNPDTAKPVYDWTRTSSATAVNLASVSGMPLQISLNNDKYRVYVRVWTEHNAISSWAFRDFEVKAPVPAVPGDDNAGLSGTPGVGTPTAVPDTYTSSAQIRMRDASNLLSVQQADFEIASDPLEYLGSGCLLARDTTESFGDISEASMSLTATAAGDMIAETTYFEVAPQAPLTLRAQGRAKTTGRTCQIYCSFYDEEFTLITTEAAVSMTDSSSTWTEVVSNINASPVNAVYMKLFYKVVGAANNEVHYLDHVGAMYGTDSAWTDGGHQSRNLLTSFLATGDDPESSTDYWEQENIATSYARATSSGAGSHGALCHQMTYNGVTSQIAYRATGTVWTSATSGTDYTLNKPAGTTDNDLLLAFVTSSESATIIPPEGWTVANFTWSNVAGADADSNLSVLKRTATSSDPSSWTTGKFAKSSSRRTAVVICYSGAAHADDQFVADNVMTDSKGNFVHRTQIVQNTDPNAWRVAAFATNDDAGSGSFVANTVPPSTSVPSPIRFVNASTPSVHHTQSNQYRINKPLGVVSGDLMIASIVLSGEVATVTPPSGWTLVSRTHREFKSTSNGDAHSGDVTVAVMKRTAGSSEPTSWIGTHTDWGQPKVTQVVAYRNCANASLQFTNAGVDEEATTAANASTISTGTVQASNSNSWRVCLFGGTTPFKSSWTGGDVYERSDSSSDLASYPDTVLQFSDSGAKVSTGDHRRSARINSVSTSTSNVPSGNFYSAVAWIGIIQPLTSPPAQGSNESERVDNNNGSSSPWLSTAVYDSNGVIPAGGTSVYGAFTPGSGTAVRSMASWIGIIKPASSTPAGTPVVRTGTWVDISDIDPAVKEMANNRITVMSSFLGSTDGTPLLGVEFAKANQAMYDVIDPGDVFNTSTWTKSWVSFEIPDGATRVRPLISAMDREVGDTVKFDRVSLSLGEPAEGEAPTWRNGTARPEHIVWSKPLIQYTDDSGIGFHDWTDLPGQKLQPAMFRGDTGYLSYFDHSIVPLNVRKYRVKTISYGLNGEVFMSDWGPDSNEVTFTALNWWLKDFSDLSTSLRLRVKYEDIQVDTDNTAVVYQPLGEDYPVVLTEGYKADSLTISIYCDRQEEAALYRLLRSNRSLLLQSDTDYAWWVRPVETLGVSNMAVSQLRRTTDPIKLITVKFVQVKPEE